MRWTLLVAALALCAPMASAETVPAAAPVAVLAPVVLTVDGREIRREQILPPAKDMDRIKQRLTGAALDKWLANAQEKALRQQVNQAAVDSFVKEMNITVTDEEVAEFVASVKAKGEASRKEAIAKERAALAVLETMGTKAGTTPEALERQRTELKKRIASLEATAEAEKGFGDTYASLGKTYIQRWKERKALQEKFGGPVYRTEEGLQAIGAQQALLTKLATDGKLVWNDQALKAAFEAHYAKASEAKPLSEEEVRKEIIEKNW